MMQVYAKYIIIEKENNQIANAFSENKGKYLLQCLKP